MMYKLVSEETWSVADDEMNKVRARSSLHLFALSSPTSIHLRPAGVARLLLLFFV